MRDLFGHIVRRFSGEGDRESSPEETPEDKKCRLEEEGQGHKVITSAQQEEERRRAKKLLRELRKQVYNEGKQLKLFNRRRL